MNADSGYRKAPQGNSQIYMNIRSAGFYQIDSLWHDREFRHTFAEMLWCNTGTFRIEDVPSLGLLHSGEACFLFPGDIHKVIATEPGELYWMCFDGPNVPLIIDNFGIKHGPYHAGDAPQHLFRQIITELNDETPEAEYMAGATGYRILSSALAGRENSADLSPLYRRFQDLLLCHYANPAFGISDYTEALRCHRSTLIRLVEKYHHCTPMEYLRTLRLKKAQELLQDPSLSIKEIALRSGFETPNYFAKVFRRCFGKNPSDSR